jgi:hypothetical protein
VLKKNKQLVEVFGLYDHLAGEYENGAVDLTATLKDSAGAPVPNFTAIPLDYVPGSDGDYRGAVAPSLDPTAGTSYVLHIESTTTGINYQIPATVKTRTGE